MLHDPMDDGYDPHEHRASLRDVAAAWMVASTIAGIGWLLLKLV